MVTIYGLKCLVNEMVYVGCTAGKLSKRMREHRSLLNSGKHSEKRMLSDWVKYGQDNFRIETLELFVYDDSAKTKREAETRWMAHFDALGLLYNSNRQSFAPPKGAQALAAKKRMENGYTPSAETRLKRRLAQLGIPKNHGAKISATKQAQKLMR